MKFSELKLDPGNSTMEVHQVGVHGGIKYLPMRFTIHHRH